MTKFMIFSILNLCAVCFVPLTALASPCTQSQRLADDSVRELIAVIKSETADEFEQILAIETLSCEERKAVRDLGFRAALLSPNEIVRTDAVFRALADKSKIVVKLIKLDRMTKEEIDFVSKYSEIFFNNYYADEENRCISIHDSNTTNCSPSTVISVSRTEIILQYGNSSGIFESSLDGKIRGFYFYKELRIPAEIDIY